LAPCFAAAALCFSAAAEPPSPAEPAPSGAASAAPAAPATPAARMAELVRASAKTVPEAPRAEAVALFRDYLALARARPGAAPLPPAAFFAALAKGLLSESDGPLPERAARAAALANALCADVPPSARAETAAALVAAASVVPRGTPGVEGLALDWLERAQALDPADLSATGAWLGIVLADALPAPDPAGFREAVESVAPPAPVFRYSIPAWEAAMLADGEDAAAATNLLARARAAWEEARPGEPVPPGWHATLSVAFDSLGDADASRRALERGIGESGRDPTLLNNLAYLLAERGEELGRALDLVDEALAARPLEPAYLDTLGWILHRRGQHEDAIDAYHKALAGMKRPDEEIAAHVALAFEALGRREEADYWWAAVPVRNAKGPAPGPEGE
jgi:tetratricopeptide (TPR) repeat protein